MRVVSCRVVSFHVVSCRTCGIDPVRIESCRPAMVFSAAFAGFFLLVDPLGGAPIFQSLTKECSAAAQIVLACKVTLIATLLLLVFIFAGALCSITLEFCPLSSRLLAGRCWLPSLRSSSAATATRPTR